MILVVGATGMLGGLISRQLLAQGRHVRVFVRDYSQSGHFARRGLATYARSLVSAGGHPVYGDLRQRLTVNAALERVKTVITTASAIMREAEDSIEDVDLRGTQSLIEAAKAAGVEHFIYISAYGADPSSPIAWLQAKGQTETRLKESGLTYTILAPDAYMEILPDMVVGKRVMYSQPATLVGEGSRRHCFISNGDVAEFAVSAVDNPSAHNQVHALGGPEAFSFQDVVKTYERVTYLPIAINLVESGEQVPDLPGQLSAVMEGLETYDSEFDTSEVALTYGVKLTSLEEFIRRQ
jgi:NADH dehydrogenase